MSYDFTIVTAVTPEYKTHLSWAISSWIFKPQLRNKPLIVYYNGLKERDLKFVFKVYPKAQLIKWEMDNIESKDELMFSAFVFGAPLHVTTPYYMKLDADAFCTNADDIWTKDDFRYDIIGHKWNYTKPGWFIDKLENYYHKKNDPLRDDRTYPHKRFESYCCLHRTAWVKQIAEKLKPRLPVPSHDTTLWFYADKEGKWGRKNIKEVGVDNSNRWKNIRESLCSGDIAFNPILNDVLMSNVQIEITSRCNIGCNQCDRNCGVIESGPDMDLSQIWQFVEDSIGNKHKWSRIDIIGGEPTMHKQLYTIFEMIKIYKDKYPKCKVRFSTNGLVDKVNKSLKVVPEWVHIRNSNKKGKEQPHSNYHCSPIDLDVKNIKSCSVPWRCGIGLTRYGYFPCGAGASLARVFGFDIGIKTLEEVNSNSIKKQMLLLCKYCGHSNSVRKLAEGNEMTKSWKIAIENYSVEKMSVI